MSLSYNKEEYQFSETIEVFTQGLKSLCGGSISAHTTVKMKRLQYKFVVASLLAQPYKVTRYVALFLSAHSCDPINKRLHLLFMFDYIAK